MIKLSIITPDKAVFEGQVTSVMVPGSAGNFEVLVNHAPIVSSLDKGKVVISNGKNEETIMITGGVVEVIQNTVTVLAEGIIVD